MKRCFLFLYLLTFSALTFKIEAQEAICSENKNLTREAYCIFLNENDAQDCYEASSEILHVGILGHDHYEVIGEKNSSMNFISWDDAQAYCDWKNNISSAEEFAVTFYVDGSDAGSIDHSLRSNLFTFSITQGASAHEAAGLEEIVADETILNDIAEIFLGFVIVEVATEHIPAEENAAPHESVSRTSTLENDQEENHNVDSGSSMPTSRHVHFENNSSSEGNFTDSSQDSEYPKGTGLKRTYNVFYSSSGEEPEEL